MGKELLKWSLVLLLIFAGRKSQSQELQLPFPTASYFSIGVGLTTNTVRDRAHSPLGYRGWGPYAFVGMEDVRDKYISRFRLSYNSFKLKPYGIKKQDKQGNANGTELRVSVGYFRNVRTASESAQYVGGSYAALVNRRAYKLPTNNINGYLVAQSIQLGVMDRWVPSGRYTLASEAEVPVLTALLRPDYMGIKTGLLGTTPSFKKMTKAFSLVTIPDFMAISARTSLHYQTRPWRTDALGGSWDLMYTRLPVLKPLVSNNSSLFYTFQVQK